jgi:uncharacterized 2Fe-2S/4Fe-4S cluster protein (DUF4445 family)
MIYKVDFLYEGRRITSEVRVGERILDVSRRLGLPVPSPCGGNGVCGKCLVEVEGMGMVQACRVYPDRDLVVRVAGRPPMQILTESYWPGRTPEPDAMADTERLDLGLAVDLGTTTVVVFLEDLRSHRNLGVQSLPNPQAAWGADVISRIHFCCEQEDGLQVLHRAITGAVGGAGRELCRVAGVDPGRVGRVAVVGNPTMLHLMAGVNPEPLATYPFTAVFLDEKQLEGVWLDPDPLRQARVELLPSVSAYVGADITAGLAAVAMEDSNGYRLYIDIGTNGEIVLWNTERILACATAAGPAFEGARISCGMAGVAGAVCAINPDGSYETIGNTLPEGLCGSGLVDAVALLLGRGVISDDGFMEEPTRLLEGRGAISLEPRDIREVQLAKGAIAAGVEVLMREAGIGPEQVQQVYLAGGFGYALHDWSARRIGLIPAQLADRLVRVGNSAGLGARLWLHAGEYRQQVRELTTRIEYVELSGHPEFNDLFVMNMRFE